MKTYDDYTQEERSAMAREDRAKLKALQAEKIMRGLVDAATPGPWYRTHGCISAMGMKFLFDVERNGAKGLHGTEADARYIAASNPKKTGELLDLITLLLKQREAAREALEQIAAERQFLDVAVPSGEPAPGMPVRYIADAVATPTNAAIIAKEALERVVEWPTS